MRKKTKKIIIKTILYLLAIIIFGLAIYLCHVENFNEVAIEKNETFYNVLYTIVIVLPTVWLILFYKSGGTLMPINRFKFSKKVDVSYNDFIELYKTISNKLLSNNYKQYKISITDKENLYIFIKEENKKLSLFLLADLITYTDRKETIIKKELEKFIEEHIPLKLRLKESFYLICVKRYSEELEKIVKETYFDGDPCMTFCLLFSTKKIYFASEKEVRIINDEDYSNLVNRFFQIIN